MNSLLLGLKEQVFYLARYDVVMQYQGSHLLSNEPGVWSVFSSEDHMLGVPFEEFQKDYIDGYNFILEVD